jgi:hypothetical protein
VRFNESVNAMMGKSVKRDGAYWRDVSMGGLAAISLLGCAGHLLDWITAYRSKDLKVALVFALGYAALYVFSPNRTFVVLLSLLAIVTWGILGAIMSRSFLGLWIVIPAALLAYLLLRWKGNKLR